MKTTIIAIGGKKTSGKDTAFKFMSSMFLPHMVKRISFADPLKDALSKVTDIPRWQFDDVGQKEEKRTILYSNNCHRKLLNLLTPMYTADCPLFSDTNINRGWRAMMDCAPTTLSAQNSTTETITFDSLRQMMQIVGTEGCRTSWDQIHIMNALEKVNIGALNVFTDVRFENEADALRSLSRRNNYNFVEIFIHRTSLATGGVQYTVHSSEPDRPTDSPNILVIENSDLGSFEAKCISVAIGATIGIYNQFS